MTNPTRQEMLDSITHKIARTGGGTGPGETGYYLPVMMRDVYAYIRPNSSFEESTKKLHEINDLWESFPDSLEKQSDDCITYIFNLISHD